MDFGIRGRAAAVAASSQGLGFACALELAREGASVAICSRDRGRVDEAARRIRDAGARRQRARGRRGPFERSGVQALRRRRGRQVRSPRYSRDEFGRSDAGLLRPSLPGRRSPRRRHDTHERDRAHDGRRSAPAQESLGTHRQHSFGHGQAAEDVAARFQHHATRHPRLREVDLVRARERQHHR